jgi:hypothetical protein
MWEKESPLAFPEVCVQRKREREREREKKQRENIVFFIFLRKKELPPKQKIK